MEYMVILGIISAVLWGMNIYVKRGVQGKVKDLTDSFIGKEQETDISPTAVTTSSAKSDYDSTVDTQGSLGGGWRVSSSEKMDYEAESKIVDTDVPYTSSDPVTAEQGYSSPGGQIQNSSQKGGSGG
ncbi:MAG: hypothetical protein WC616_01360 [Candidatus Omnitrophota bacterium]